MTTELRRLVFAVLCFFSVLVNAAGHSLDSYISARSSTIIKAKKYLETRDPTPFRPTIDVYWHVIYSNENSGEGNLLDRQIFNQMESLNKDFEQAGLSFSLKETRRIHNASWFHLYAKPLHVTPDTTEWQMKAKLALGNSSALNIYSMAGKSRVRIDPSSTTLPGRFIDGVVVDARYVFDGHVFRKHHLTELVGLWAGLYHTYHGGCDPVNDGVDDTPAHTLEEWSTIQWFLCKTRESTCPGALPEPSDNFMSGSPDFCRERFTPGQIKRMRKFLEDVRGVRFEGPWMLQHKPAYRVFSSKKQYAVLANPNLALSIARKLYADKGQDCIVVIDVDNMKHICKLKADLDVILAQYKNVDTCR